MKLLAFVHKRLLFFCCALACLLALCWFAFSEDFWATPEPGLAGQRLAAGIALGWGWLHAEDMRVLSMSPVGRNVAIRFAYTVVVDKGKDELPPGEEDRFYQFLPMCGEAVLITKGRCAVEETLEFMRTEEYGWMPRVFVDFRPELLPRIQQQSSQ